MAKIIQKCAKYTLKELEEYNSRKSSCVRKVNSDMHLSLGVYSLADFKHAMHAHVVQTKVGFYDADLGGIVLDIKNIKVLGTTATLRTDDPTLHININANFYVFCPEVGVVMSGIVKHISKGQVGVIIYRVFNATIRFINKVSKNEIVMNQELNFRIKNFDLQTVFPYIEGEIILSEADGRAAVSKKFKKFEMYSEADSGVDIIDDNQELDELLNIIKQEPTSEAEALISPNKVKKEQKKRKRQISEKSPDVPAKQPQIKTKKTKVKKEQSEENTAEDSPKAKHVVKKERHESD